MAEQIHLVAASLLYKSKSGALSWFLVKDGKDSEWEVPKTVAKHGESSVRAAIRQLGEQAGMRVKVLEEVGRHGGAAKVNNRILTQRTIYYLIAHKDGEQILGFTETDWVEHSSALRKVTSKLDREMLKDARMLLMEIRAKKKKKKAEIDRLEKEAAAS